MSLGLSRTGHINTKVLLKCAMNTIRKFAGKPLVDIVIYLMDFRATFYIDR